MDQTIERESPPVVLNVDDDEANRYAVTRILRRAGFTVREAGTGAEALRLIREGPEPLDLVVLDVRLPDMDGREVAQRIRSDPATASVGVVQLSAHAVASDERAEGLERGADIYLTQPLEPRELVAAVRAVLRIRRSEEAARRAAERLAEADRRKDEFLAMLGHELRNPLQTLAMALQMAPPGQPLEPRIRGIMQRQVALVRRLLDDLLDVSRITRGKIELKRARVDLRDTVRAVLEARGERLHQAGLDVDVRLSREPALVEGDPARLEQVVTNLCENAAKYTERGGRVVLSVDVDEGADLPVVLRVRDTGIGIEPARLPHIFDLFVQAHAGIDRRDGGLGIGLTLVRSLVELHGGRVQAHSEGPGRGSTFEVALPAAALPPAEARSTGGRRSEPSSGLRVLVVEDNRDARELLELLLRRRGHTVRAAPDGEEAIRVALDWRPDVALVDLGLPGVDGFGVGERIRDAWADAVYLVALSGYGRDADRERTREAGFDAHLVKPVEMSDLERLLTEVREAGS